MRQYTIKNFDDVQRVLREFIPNTRKENGYTLHRMEKLMKYIGDPQNTYKVIHVAGTSGKTSTSYFCASLLHYAGKKVGLTVSPHVDQVNERVQIGLIPLPENEYCSEFSVFLSIIRESGIKPSYFEFLVAFAYWVFARQKVDYAVVEVGLGGLLDATNVITRSDKVCVITDIGYDHIDVLGNTLEKIAAQKAGIIHKNNPVFTHLQSRDVIDTLSGAASISNSHLEIIDTYETEFDNNLPLFQIRNFCLAKHAVAYSLKQEGRLLDKTVQSGASKVYIPARMECIEFEGKTLIMDGSHNEQKLNALTDAILKKYKTPTHALVSFGENKHQTVKDSLGQIRRMSDKIILTKFSTSQDEPRKPIGTEELSEYCRELQFEEISIVDEPDKALSQLLKSEAKVCIITGSYYLLNDIRYLLKS